MTEDRPKGLTIGAVTRLTGVPAETLRTWERRYGLVEPLREGDRRLYTEAQVRRLRAIAALADLGERVGDLARLSDDELAARVRLHDQAPPASTGPLRVVVVDPTAGRALGGAVPELGASLEVVAGAQAPDALPPPEGPVDALVVDLACLGAAPGAALDALRARLNPRAVLLVHTFLSRPARRRLDRPGLLAVRGPLSTAELRRRAVEHALAERARPGPPSPPSPPRFERARLNELLDLRPSLACECPNHLASLVLQLRDFEAYSRACERTAPQDAALHDELADGTARAAAWMETLLARVLAHDGLEP